MRKQRSTLAHVAQRAGVSQATVSRLISGDLGVCGRETAGRIFNAISDIGYVPPPRRRRSKKDRTMEKEKTVVPNSNDPFPFLTTR